jgi:hypothetical protein
VLPLLHRGKLVGRMDAKAHRQQGIFEIKSLYLEAGVRVTRTLAQDLAKALQRWPTGTRRRPWPTAIFRPSCWRCGRSTGCEGI